MSKSDKYITKKEIHRQVFLMNIVATILKKIKIKQQQQNIQTTKSITKQIRQCVKGITHYDQAPRGIFPGIQVWFNIQKQVSVIQSCQTSKDFFLR